MSAWSSDEDVRLPPSGGAGLPSPTPGPDPAEEKFKRRAEAAFNFFGEKHQGSVMMTRKQLLEVSAATFRPLHQHAARSPDPHLQSPPE